MNRVPPIRTRYGRRGVTLLELLLASGLILLTMATLFLFYQISLDSTQWAEKYNLQTLQARVVLQRMAQEIRQATGGPGDKAVVVSGQMHSLTIRTSVLPPPSVMDTREFGEEMLAPAGDLRQVEYYLAVDPESVDEEGNPGVVGLVRRERKGLERAIVFEDEEVIQEEVRMMAADVKYIRFRYFDGTTWQDFWQGAPGSNGLPAAIKLEIGFAPDGQMLAGQEPTGDTDFDILGNPTGTVPVRGRHSLIVRPQAVGLFAGAAGGAQREMGGLPTLEGFGSGMQ